MSKKRPRLKRSPRSGVGSAPSKLDPKHWSTRLFKSRYYYKGRQLEVRNWSVKIQHLGERKTFALRSSRRGMAAAEACELYRTLVTRGWKAVLSRPRGPVEMNLSSPGGDSVVDPNNFGLEYWTQRLSHREYTMSLRGNESRELAVRINQGPAGYYFPLGTDDSRVAADRALRIHQDIVSHGWEWVEERYSRELTVGFRWLDVPLAWTYTTIHTQIPGSLPSAIQTDNTPGDAVLVSITESDGGVRRALEWCVNHMAGFRCVAAYASAAEALRESTRQRFHLALINHSLADKPGTACLADLKAAVPKAAGLLYAAYQDSEELFRATPGGAGTYLLKRTPPTQFLEPISGRLKAGCLLGQELAPAAWEYFKESLASMPVGGSTRLLANLTQREHEVLALLGKGHPDKDIADQLGISIHTVHEHVRNIFDKLGAHNRTEAAVRLLQK